MNYLSRFIDADRTLIAQLVFTTLAFVVMTVLSYVFMTQNVHESLIRSVESIQDFTEDQIEISLVQYETILESFAEEVSRRIELENADQDSLQAYIEEISRFTFLDGKKMSGIQDFFIYWQDPVASPLLLHSSQWVPPEGYRPETQSWYRLALEADGSVTATTPSINEAGDVLFTYTKALFDRNNRRVAVVCLNVKINFLGQSVVDTALEQGGYGILINQEGMVMFHPNENFVSLSMYDSAIPFSKFAQDISSGAEIFEGSLTSYKQEEAVAFSRTLTNGWHLMLVAPKEQYYESMSHMGFVVTVTAVILASILISILISLNKAREKADEESRQKSTFLANMSHEIRTPINAIVGMSAIGRAASEVERKDYCFNKIDDASRHLLGVINDVLDLSKIEAYKMEISPTDFNFERMLQQVVNVVNFRIDEKHQKLTVFIDKDIPKILFADDQRLSQVITNLLSNAAKFTPDQGSISLEARLLSENHGTYLLEVKVSDNGIGISPEQQSKLFQSFQQAESSTTRKYGGTGLGLVISKNIVELMGGDLRVESEVGRGSRFTFTVNVEKGDDKQYGLAYQHINWGNIRILTVDDDRDILAYFCEIIKSFGADCDVTTGAEGALELVDKNGDYNIYFVDLKMPGTDGIALTKKIRAKEKNPGSSIVIMISSADLSSVEDEAKKAGVDKFLLKPLFPSTIADMINECIGITNEKANDTPVDLNGIFEGHHILFAEDVDINREIVLTLLEPTLLNIDCADNGAEAVKMFIKQPEKYDLIFMDVQMPEMDGYEATRQIRALDTPAAKQIPIIAMTANVFKEDVARCLAAGMNGHLGKPLDMNDLLRLTLKYLGEEPSQA